MALNNFHMHVFFHIRVLFSLFLALASLSAPASPTSRELLGTPAIAFHFPDLNKQGHSLNDWKGLVVVLNFWGSWCAPCQKEIPLLNELAVDYKSAGVQFVGIAVDNSFAVDRFIKIIPIDYTVLIGNNEAIDVALRYGDQAGTLPYTVFIGRDGNIAAIASGPLTKEYIRTTLDKLLPDAR